MMNAGFAGYMPIVDTYGSSGAGKGTSASASRDTGFSDTLSSVAKDTAPTQQDESQPPSPAPTTAAADGQGKVSPVKSGAEAKDETNAAPADDAAEADPGEAAGEEVDKVSSKASDEKAKENHGRIVADVANQADVKEAGKDAEAGKADAKADPAEEAKADADDGTGVADDAPKSADSEVKSLLALLSSSASSTAIAAAAQDQTGSKVTNTANAGKQKDADAKSSVEDVAADLKADAKALGARQSDKAGQSETDHVVPGLSDTGGRQSASASDEAGLAGLSVSKTSRAAADKTLTGNTDQTLNVEVLDSRRFLGFTQNTNSSNVLKAVTGDQSWTSAMQNSASTDMTTESGIAASKVVNTLKIQMNPIDLGSVTATLKLVGEQLVVDLKVENSHAYRQLKDDQQNMVNALRSQGYAVDQISVSMAPTPDKPSTSTGQDTAQGQGFAQQQAGQGSAGGSGQGNGSSSRNSTGEDQRYASPESVSTSSSASQQGARSGQVYL
ncbi:flagellar hook-length control protein FliK [Rhizobium sp. PAMB 3182]